MRLPCNIFNPRLLVYIHAPVLTFTSVHMHNIIHNAASCPPTPMPVGGAEEWGDVQRAPGELRLVDEHPVAGSGVHRERGGPVLENARVLRAREHNKVSQSTG